MPKAKKFLDKKNSTTFILAHRSQRDPLTADENAPQNVLVPLDQIPSFSGEGPAHQNKHKKEVSEKRKEELLKYGIYFDDDYDYLQHLRDSKEVSNVQWDFCERIYAPKEIPEPDEMEKGNTVKKEDLKGVKLKLPSSVFESEFKEDIGLLNKAATSKGPRPDLDPDIIAALDDDFDFQDPTNELEDNFIELANLGTSEIIQGEPNPKDLDGLFSSDEEGRMSEEDNSDYENEREDSLRSLHGPHYSSDDETKTRFTNYSMSSSVVRRNKQLLLVDDRFEKMFEGYDDTEIGALDCDEIEGDINPGSDLLLKYADEFENDKKKEEILNEKITHLALRNAEEESSEDENMTDSEGEERKKEDKWDCESILSTYSNIKNRPKIISEPSKRIRINGKTGLPVGVLGKGLTQQNLKQLDNAFAQENNQMVTRSNARSMMSGATSIRAKDETTEERRERKKLVKEYRKERILERKANTEAFKDEKKRLVKVRLNDKHNVQGLKL